MSVELFKDNLRRALLHREVREVLKTWVSRGYVLSPLFTPDVRQDAFNAGQRAFVLRMIEDIESVSPGMAAEMIGLDKKKEVKHECATE